MRAAVGSESETYDADDFEDEEDGDRKRPRGLETAVGGQAKQRALAFGKKNQQYRRSGTNTEEAASLYPAYDSDISEL